MVSRFETVGDNAGLHCESCCVTLRQACHGRGMEGELSICNCLLAAERLALPAAQVGGGEGKVTAIELPAAAVAVADGFQELEWLLLAGALALMRSASDVLGKLLQGVPAR